jgi:nucleoside-diphosphate-sugar epimerase
MDSKSIVVTGGGGFIGGHLVGRLLEDGRPVRSVDHKRLDDWYQVHSEAENVCLDLRLADACYEALSGASEVYNFAADMGGMGFIESNKALCMLSVLINTHLLQASVAAGVKRFFFSSSACVYAEEKQISADVIALKESDAYPAMPEDGYGWEKLFSERNHMENVKSGHVAESIGHLSACVASGPYCGSRCPKDAPHVRRAQLSTELPFRLPQLSQP